uniref:KIB1-4 beta-propeller domain-containing protein n=1 Tax=Chenopodium quinoa TaxID=63459 RepID=A0A803MFS8_CHEQI
MPETETLLVAAEKMSRQETSWSDTPADILSVITNRLETRLEFCSFRAVCKTWQGAAPLSRFAEKDNILSQILPHHFSITVLHQEYQHPPQNLVDEPLVLVSNSVFLVESIANPNNPPFLFATEEFYPGKLNLRKPLGRYNYGTLPKNFPQNLDLSRFHLSEISRLYTLTKEPDPLDYLTRKNRNSRMFDKVIMFASTTESKHNNNTSTPEIRDYSLMMLYNNGGRSGLLAKISLGDGLMSPLHGHGDMKFDDIVMFKESVCAVDRKGRGFWVDNGVLGEMFAMNKTTDEDFEGCWKKRLVEFCGELYLVTRCPMHMKVAFEVYKLNEKSKTWDKLDGIGKDRILFATVDGCFFVPARDLPACSGNCIVVGRDVFPSYNANDDELESYWESPDIAAAFEVVIFDFGSGEWRPLETDPEYGKVLYPQPWLSLDANMSSKLFSRKGKEVVQDSFSEKCLGSSGTREASSSLGHRLDKQANDIPLPAADIILENLSTENLSALALGITTNLYDNSTTVAGSALTITEPLKSGVIAKTKFQGIEVSPDLIPTLEEIWANHGNIIDGSMIGGKYALRWALESMAKMAILVQNSLDGSLSESQANYVCSTLYHLQILRFNVSWLVPSIVKALNMYNSIANIEARSHARGG